MNCIHDWDYTDGPSGLFNCQKCGELIDSTDAMNRLNMLESDLANERALYAEKQTELAVAEAFIDQLIDACGGRWDQRLRDETKWLKCLRVYNKKKDPK